MNNGFIKLVWATLKENNIEAKDNEDAIKKFKELKKETPAEKKRMEQLGIEKPNLLKGIIFISKENITKDKFTDFIDKGIVKIDDDTYMQFWNDGISHESIERKLKEKYNIQDVEYFATSVNDVNELDTYDFRNNLKKHKKYSPELIKAAMKLFDTKRINKNY